MKNLLILMAVPTALSAQDNRFYDEVTIETEGYNVLVTYYNSDHQVSAEVEETTEVNGVSFTYKVKVGHVGPEIFSVEVHTPGYMVIPQDVYEVLDGHEVTAYISPIAG